MIYKADLHTHSTASDGLHTPAELARLVKARGAELWALTDHDSVNGVEEAQEAGGALGLRVVQGVELSADDYLNLHILGYGFSAWKFPWTRWTRKPPEVRWAVPILPW